MAATSSHSHAPRTRGDRVSAPRLLGRVHEMAVLAALVEKLRRGGAGAVVVEGYAGLGKSRLLAETATMARAAGAMVAAVLIYRLITFWLLLPVGWGLWVALRRRA